MLLSASVTAYADIKHPICLIWVRLCASSKFSGCFGSKSNDSKCHNHHFSSHVVYLKLPAWFCESVFSATVMESTKPAFHRLLAFGCGPLCWCKDDWVAANLQKMWTEQEFCRQGVVGGRIDQRRWCTVLMFHESWATLGENQFPVTLKQWIATVLMVSCTVSVQKPYMGWGGIDCGDQVG